MGDFLKKMSDGSLTDTESLNKLSVALKVLLLKILEHTAALTYHHKKTSS